MAARKLENQSESRAKSRSQGTAAKRSSKKSGSSKAQGTRADNRKQQAGSGNKRKSSSAKEGSKTRQAGENRKARPTAEDFDTYRDQLAFETGITVLVGLIISMFMYLCYFGLCGKLGKVISGFSFGFLGWLAWLVPVYAMVSYIFAEANPGDQRVPRKVISAGVFLLLLSALKELIFPQEILTEFFTSNHVLHKDYFECLYLSFEDVALHGKGSGGMIGRGIGNLFSSVLGTGGAGAVLFGMLLLSAYIFHGLELMASLRQKNAYREEMSEAYDEFIEEEADYIEPSYRVRPKHRPARQVSAPVRRKPDLQPMNLVELSEKLDELEAKEKEEQKNQKKERERLRKQAEQKKKEQEKAEKSWEAAKPDNQPSEEELLIPVGMEQIKAPSRQDYPARPDSNVPDTARKESADILPDAGDGRQDVMPDGALENVAHAEQPEKKAPQIPIFREEMEQKFGQKPMDSFAPKEEVKDIRAMSQIIKEEQEMEGVLSGASSAVEGTAAGAGMDNTPSIKTQSSRKQERNAGNSASPGEKSASAGEAAVPKKAAVQEQPYQFPPLDLLGKPSKPAGQASDDDLRQTAQRLKDTLESFHVDVEMGPVTCGPTVTRYEVLPAQGVRVNKITNLADDLKLSMAVQNIRIEAPIPGKAAVGIEVPNDQPSAVHFRELLEGPVFDREKSPVTFAVGKDIAGKVVVTDIAKMPHLLVAGATGSGKSVCINTLIMSILYKADPNEVKLIMIDPKVVELSVYNGIPHLFCPVVTDPKQAAASLNWAVREMMDRYEKFKELGVRNISGYNAKIKSVENAEEAGYSHMPFLVIIVDEFADLMMVASKEVEDAVCRLAQLARAAGIHLILATQRPSVNVITGLIKANIPSRIAFSVSSAIDSRTILDQAGAEKLLGKGDMLFFPSGYTDPVRLQGAFVSDKEVSDVVDFIKEHNAAPSYNDKITEVTDAPAEEAGSAAEEKKSDVDEYFEEAGRFVIESGRAAAGQLQRRFSIGFNRAGRIIDQLNKAGVVGPAVGTKPRAVLMDMEQFEAYVNGEEPSEEQASDFDEADMALAEEFAD